MLSNFLSPSQNEQAGFKPTYLQTQTNKILESK